MGRRCSICHDPQHEAINYDLLQRQKTYAAVAAEYNVSEDAIKRHVKNHLKEKLKVLDEAREARDDAVVLKALDVLEMIIQKGPELMDTATINQVLRAIELHQRYTGDDTGPGEIRIVWGMGLDDEDNVDERIVSNIEDFETVEEDSAISKKNRARV